MLKIGYILNLKSVGCASKLLPFHNVAQLFGTVYNKVTGKLKAYTENNISQPVLVVLHSTDVMDEELLLEM